MLAILLLDANRVVSIDRLAEELYGDERPTSAVTQIHGHVSHLRKLLGSGESLLETRAPGYVIRPTANQLDLNRFEHRAQEAGLAAEARGDLEVAATQLEDALGLWRGGALADLDQPFARLASARLEDLRLAAREKQVDVWLALGRTSELVATLEGLIAAYPFRERFRAQLMLALYRSGRQADALAEYGAAREVLVDEQFGIEPTPALHRLQHAILTQDRTLDTVAGDQRDAQTARVVLVAPSDEAAVGPLLALSEPLGRLRGKELVISRLVAHEDELRPAAAALNSTRAELSVTTRAAVFTSADPAPDLVRLATTQDAELVVVDDRCLEEDGVVAESLAVLFAQSPADVAVVCGAVDFGAGDGVFVPFCGDEHDWAALELAALLADAAGLPLRLVGTSADPVRRRRDASRLLAAASLAVERALGVATEPILADPRPEALLDAVQPAALVVFGISPRWRSEGIGSTCRALVRDGRAPVVVVHRGPRPGALLRPRARRVSPGRSRARPCERRARRGRRSGRSPGRFCSRPAARSTRVR